MASTISDASLALSAKIVIAGAFGVGKTTFVAAISEIPVASTEALMPVAAAPADDVSFARGKTTTTVAMDFGRIAVDDGLTLYLFGTPGQDRFWFLWDDLARGALAAIVLVDTRNLAASWPAIAYFERRGDIPFTVVVNLFDGQLTHELAEVRDALDLSPGIPLTTADARDRRDVREALRALIRHALNLLPSH
ncbi:ATP/GTP-binding protein [Actinocrinis puniceicyclus]|uniref:ATP/GTP-binding protein n=1 Tax=Actinocrinis puniceicyclus TaxID=977794 RepID=A0A8J7WM95_9ACTN|nr:ATP/GTP-binding protein [Actinocrinis puniceicyclus]